MRIKNILLSILTLCAVLYGINPYPASAAELEYGTLGILLQADSQKLSEYKASNPDDGEGVFVYVQNIDTEEIYRFPLSKSNGYSGRFDILYGNYRVIPNPDASSKQNTIGCDTVFTIGKSAPDVSIQCFIEKPESNDTTEIAPTASPAAQSVATPAPAEEEESKKSLLTGQNIFTVIVFIAVFGIWIYNRFFKHRG